ncbi:Uncharacterised protein [Moraxella caprae]|uniref:Uncharacterized protein n=1 Tax=Moraxella caprae TaxID=90240 RepID=A0A378R2R4_9GAMM|nr:hypothetical protein [Moraxella caprae]STZ08937.1 Uncharacterised protein [Moraxella caprae]
MTYSLDFRKKALALINDKGMSYRKVHPTNLIFTTPLRPHIIVFVVILKFLGCTS